MTRFRPTTEIYDTSLMGEIEVSYEQLVKVFGEPNVAPSDKTHATWGIEFADGSVATVYDWKHYGQSVEQINRWHVGGKDTDVVTRVIVALGIRLSSWIS